MGRNRRKTILVFVVGGLAHTELATLRMLAHANSLTHRLIFGTTKLVTAKTFTQDLIGQPHSSLNQPNKSARGSQTVAAPSLLPPSAGVLKRPLIQRFRMFSAATAEMQQVVDDTNSTTATAVAQDAATGTRRQWTVLLPYIV